MVTKGQGVVILKEKKNVYNFITPLSALCCEYLILQYCNGTD